MPADGHRASALPAGAGDPGAEELGFCPAHRGLGPGAGSSQQWRLLPVRASIPVLSLTGRSMRKERRDKQAREQWPRPFSVPCGRVHGGGLVPQAESCPSAWTPPAPLPWELL